MGSASLLSPNFALEFPRRGLRDDFFAFSLDEKSLFVDIFVS